MTAAVTIRGIDEVLKKISDNRQSIKELLLAKNELVHNIQTVLRHKAKAARVLSPGQICDYREFSRLYDRQCVSLKSHMAALRQKMDEHHIQHEILKPSVDLAAIYGCLQDINLLQGHVLTILHGIVAAARQAYDALLPDAA